MEVMAIPTASLNYEVFQRTLFHVLDALPSMSPVAMAQCMHHFAPFVCHTPQSYLVTQIVLQHQMEHCIAAVKGGKGGGAGGGEGGVAGEGGGEGNGAGNGAGRGTRRGTVPVHRPARWPHRRGRPRVPAPEAATTRAVVVRAGEVPRPASSRGASICCVDGPRPRRGALWWIRDGVVYHLAFVRLARFYRLSMCHVTYDNAWWVSCKSPSTPPSLPFVSPRDCIL